MVMSGDHLSNSNGMYDSGDPATVRYGPDDFACDLSPTSLAEEVSTNTSGYVEVELMVALL